jgi:predicted SnoaL-like aldol condensation-catalyzing enzyme
MTHFLRSIAEEDFVVLPCHKEWTGRDEYAGSDIFRFDKNEKVVENWDVLRVITGKSKIENGLF